ncbi:MAG TPA: riboflavin kinase [Clostridia bacterium]|nr:riboflavin kinase [Clostridia bacterium]
MKYDLWNNVKLENTCVAFGEFDGVHSGHLAVVERLKTHALRGMTSVVVSFAPVEENLQDKKILSTEEEKQYLLARRGLDVMLSYPVDKEAFSLKQFALDVLVRQLGARVVVAGSNYEQLDQLRTYAAEFGFELDVCDAVMLDGAAISADTIKDDLAAGRLEHATALLGHPYLFMGTVMHGKARGRLVGMPTANLGYKPYKQLPVHGVYGTLSDIDGHIVKGLTNIGKRPSDDNFDYVSIETFLLDFAQDLYDKTITLEIHVHIRGVIKFNSLEEVKQQVDRDIVSIRAFLDRY